MTCQEVLRLLYEVIDNEASPLDSEQVKQHLGKCKDCAAVYRLEEEVDQFFKAKATESTPSQETVQLKSKILSELDSIDSKIRSSVPAGSPIEEARPQSSTSSSFPLRILAIAASIIIVIGAFYYGTVLTDHHAAYIPLEQAHWDAVAVADQFANQTNTNAAQAQLASDWKMTVAPELEGYTLIGGQDTKVDGVEMTHFLYGNGTELVSLFVTCAKSFKLPEGLTDSQVMVNNIEFFDHDCRGCRLVFHRHGDAMLITASTNRQLDLLHFQPERGAI